MHYACCMIDSAHTIANDALVVGILHHQSFAYTIRVIVSDNYLFHDA